MITIQIIVLTITVIITSDEMATKYHTVTFKSFLFSI